MTITDWDTPESEELLVDTGPPRRPSRRQSRRENGARPGRRTAVLLSASERSFLRGVAHHLGQASDTTVAVSGVLRAIVAAVSTAGLDFDDCETVADLKHYLRQLLKGADDA